MPTYIVLTKWTDQGAKNAKDAVQRMHQFRSDLEHRGCKLRSCHWTQGQYDSITIVEAPDEQTGMAALLALGSLGNVHTETLRAYNETEMEAIIQKM
ncbi:GYD domain-containing protein [Ktedonospora formicarum]|uniref:GYD domain-containing protein n=1 Tax=Ktedonospora formicarum TaxID=2778364 RepID=A0A8J3IAL4_9CHLR|nr:GYD domain-containing protein [Ktedonospora formicarum]GHO48768.1 GYD domain-containing protein [Ktedonospora formicarum]